MAGSRYSLNFFASQILYNKNKIKSDNEDMHRKQEKQGGPF
jgi:hypothetical protein